MNHRGRRILCAFAALCLAAAGMLPAWVIYNPWRKTAAISRTEAIYSEVYKLRAVTVATICAALAYIAFRVAFDKRRNPVPTLLVTLTFGAVVIYTLMPQIYISPAESSLGETYPMFPVLANEPQPKVLVVSPWTNEPLPVPEILVLPHERSASATNPTPSKQR